MSGNAYWEVPSVSVEKFTQAWEIYQQTLEENPGDPDPIYRQVKAVRAVALADDPTGSTWKSHALSHRIFALHDLILKRRKRVTKHSGFPEAWLAAAAEAKLSGFRFTAADFPWPKNAPAVQAEAA
jgi:hypothetical protein